MNNIKKSIIENLNKLTIQEQGRVYRFIRTRLIAGLNYGEKEAKLILMRFKDLPKGTRFKYPDGDDIWVAIETHNDGLIVKWISLIN